MNPLTPELQPEPEALALIQAVEAMPHPAFLADPAGRVVYLNQRWGHWPPLPTIQLTGLDSEFVHPEDRTTLAMAYRAVLGSATPFSHYARLKAGDGHYRLHSIRAEPVYEQGRLLAWVGTITEPGLAPARLSSTTAQVWDALAVPIAVLDQEGRIVEVNRAWREFAQANGGSDYLGHNYLGVCRQAKGFDALGAAQAADSIQAVLAGEEGPFRLEYPCHSPEEERWFVMTVSPLAGHQGHWAVVTHENVTQRKRAELALRESEARFRAISQYAPTGILLVNPAGHYLYLNTVAEQILGVSQAEMLGRHWAEGVHPDDRQWVMDRWQQAAEEQKPYEGYFRWVQSNGEICSCRVRTHPFLGEDGSLLGYSGSLEDLTRRTQAEEAAARLAAIVASSSDAIVSKTLEGIVTSWNASAERIFGYTAEEMIGQSILRLIPPELQYEEDQILARLKAGERIEHYQTLRITKDGRYLNISLTISPVRDRSGRIIGASKIARDITEQKRAEEELRQSEERFRKLAEAQKRFVNDAAHELRAPLTSIQGNLEILRRFKMKKSDRDEALAEVTKEAARLSRLVNDMLALARGDAGDQLHLVEVRLDRVLKQTFETVRVLGKAHRMHLGELPEVRLSGDSDRLQQLAFQLLENAIKYTPDGGEVRLELSMGDGYAEFRVSDSGMGIAPEDLPRVFERFFRADKARTRSVGGTGLGLSIARWIVEEHGGQIWLESEVGKGTTAFVRLPLLEE